MTATKNMTLRMDERLAEKVRHVAEVEGTTMSAVGRDALTEHIERRLGDPEFWFQEMLQDHRHERHRTTILRLNSPCPAASCQTRETSNRARGPSHGGRDHPLVR